MRFKTHNTSDQNFSYRHLWSEMMVELVQAQAAEQNLQKRLQMAQVLLSEARKLTDRRDHPAAAKRYREAIERIGSAYRSAGMRDDTGTKLTFAEASAREGDWAQALALFDRVTEARLALLLKTLTEKR